MNPHYGFISVMLVSLVITVAMFAASGQIVEIQGMAEKLGITLACVGVILLVTRKYWKGARRMA